MKRKITSLTSGIQKSLIISNILSNLLPAIICIALVVIGGFGVSVRFHSSPFNNLGSIYLRYDKTSRGEIQILRAVPVRLNHSHPYSDLLRKIPEKKGPEAHQVQCNQ